MIATRKTSEFSRQPAIGNGGATRPHCSSNAKAAASIKFRSPLPHARSRRTIPASKSVTCASVQRSFLYARSFFPSLIYWRPCLTYFDAKMENMVCAGVFASNPKAHAKKAKTSAAPQENIAPKPRSIAHPLSITLIARLSLGLFSPQS